jgi:hypothetical protein
VNSTLFLLDRFLEVSRVALPENPLSVTLNFRVALSFFKAFFRPHAILGILFDTGKAAVEFPGSDRSRSRTEEGIKNHIPLVAAGKDQFGKEFLALAEYDGPSDEFLKSFFA